MEKLKVKIGIVLVSVMLIISCSKKEGANNENKLKEFQKQTTEITDVNFSDSLGDVKEQIAFLKAELVSKRSDIKAIIAKRDSILKVVAEVENSLAKVNASKIEPGIAGVNAKLNELKGQKENLVEQLSLQKQEIVLAEKKIGLLGEEKIVYDAQRKALWDKGAPPAEFTDVDALLAGINDKISEQKLKLKNLNRNVSDIEEQITSIGGQRESLSTKIRNNYTAQQIFDEYSKEEKAKLNEQLASIDKKLEALVVDEEVLNVKLAKLTGEKTDFELKQDQLTQKTAAEQLAIAQQEMADKEAQKKTRVTYAIVIIGIVILVIGLFYVLGKYKRAQKGK
ncbi:hypothetical protein [Lutibacter sp.]|uniref:hypothetical protein n=1 Tax=Lutibacter sp. TaxID=1925666 RepID=UPI00356327B1